MQRNSRVALPDFGECIRFFFSSRIALISAYQRLGIQSLSASSLDISPLFTACIIGDHGACLSNVGLLLINARSLRAPSQRRRAYICRNRRIIPVMVVQEPPPGEFGGSGLWMSHGYTALSRSAWALRPKTFFDNPVRGPWCGRASSRRRRATHVKARRRDP